jgi:hypothetical protein
MVFLVRIRRKMVRSDAHFSLLTSHCSLLKGSYDAETFTVVPKSGEGAIPCRGTQVLTGGTPVPAAEYTQIPFGRTGRIGYYRISPASEDWIVPVPAPFIHISSHVI